MAGAGGFEPPYGGIKIRCLTTWLRPTGKYARTGRDHADWCFLLGNRGMSDAR
jgi:hypothetical protein